MDSDNRVRNDVVLQQFESRGVIFHQRVRNYLRHFHSVTKSSGRSQKDLNLLYQNMSCEGKLEESKLSMLDRRIRKSIGVFGSGKTVGAMIQISFLDTDFCVRETSRVLLDLRYGYGVYEAAYGLLDLGKANGGYAPFHKTLLKSSLACKRRRKNCFKEALCQNILKGGNTSKEKGTYGCFQGGSLVPVQALLDVKDFADGVINCVRLKGNSIHIKAPY